MHIREKFLVKTSKLRKKAPRKFSSLTRYRRYKYMILYFSRKSSSFAFFLFLKTVLNAVEIVVFLFWIIMEGTFVVAHLQFKCYETLSITLINNLASWNWYEKSFGNYSILHIIPMSFFDFYFHWLIGL